MKEHPKQNWANTLTLVGAVASMVMTIIYGTWFVSTIEKRVSLLEQNNAIYSQQMQELKNEQIMANDAQDKAFIRFQDSINGQLSRMEDKIEKIYTMMAKTRVKDHS